MLSPQAVRAGVLVFASVVVAGTAAAQTARTPWGDPDLQGNYTNKYETSTPFERPKEFEGRRMADITAEEQAAVARKRQEETLARAKFFGGDPEGLIGNAAEFRDIYEISKGSRPWFVIEPEDGRIPALRPEAKARIDALPRSGSSFGNGPFYSHLDFSLWDRCITRGLPGSMMPGQYGNSFEIVQAPGFVAIRYEMVHETRIIPLDRRPKLGASLSFDMGDARGWWTATRSSSRHATSKHAASTAMRVPRRCDSSNASDAPHRRQSSGRSRLTIRPHGRGRGHSRSR